MHKSICASATFFTLAFFGGCGAAMASPIEIYANNFDSSATYGSGITGGLSGITTTTSIQNLPTPFSGNMLVNTSVPAKATTLTLNGLPTHTSISLQFLLATLDSWDGVGSAYGPDSMNVKIDGTQIFSAVFDSSEGKPTYTFPTGTMLAPHKDMFGYGFRPEYALDMGADPLFQSIAHTASTLVIQWFAGGPGWQGGDNESWGMDNLKVTLNGAASVPEPAAAGLLAVGLMGMGAAARRRRQG